MSTIRNRVLSSLPLAITLCSLGLRLTLSPTGCARLRPPHDRGDHGSASHKPHKKTTHKGWFSLVGLVGLEPMTPTMSTESGKEDFLYT